MESVTETCVVPKSKSQVFEFLLTIENMPKWSTEFVKEIFQEGGKYKAKTPLGIMFIRFDTDKNAGTIDIYAGPTEEQMTGGFLRVIDFSPLSTGVMFTFFKYSDVTDDLWKTFCLWIKKEIGNICKIFSE
jgi:hypothetical protein